MNIRSLFKRFRKGISYLLPFQCILCDDRIERRFDLCSDCESYLPWLKNTCIYCANPLTFKTQAICGACLKTPSLFKRASVPFSYTQIIKNLIGRLKFQRRLAYANILGYLLAEKIKYDYKDDQLPDVIIPVPLHKKRLCQRGFNQATEIARPISRYLNIPINHQSCKRIHNTEAQSRLAAHRRLANVKSAFTAELNLNGQHVALLDDVITTGHTLTELGHILYYVGVNRVDLWCCAKTLIVKK